MMARKKIAGLERTIGELKMEIVRLKKQKAAYALETDRLRGLLDSSKAVVMAHHERLIKIRAVLNGD